MSKQSTTNGVPSRMMPRTPMQAPRRTTAVRERSKVRARHHPYNRAMVLAFLLGFLLGPVRTPRICTRERAPAAGLHRGCLLRTGSERRSRDRLGTLGEGFVTGEDALGTIPSQYTRLGDPLGERMDRRRLPVACNRPADPTVGGRAGIGRRLAKRGGAEHAREDRHLDAPNRPSVRWAGCARRHVGQADRRGYQL